MRMLVLAVLLFAQRPSSLPIQTGTVTGRLLNSDGSPAVKIRVSAMAIPEARNSTDAPALITLTETDSTGRYRLADVPVGRYFIVAGFVDSPTYYPRGTGPSGATAVSVTARATTANIDFRIERPSSGLTVSGRVIVEAPQSFGTVQVLLNGGPSGSYTNMNVPAKLDGSFEFVRVRPGTYNISVNPTPFSQPRTVVVTEKDVTGLELRIPWTAEVSGRAVVEGGDPVPTFQISFTGGASRQASSYFSGQPNQTFRATLAEGFYGITATGIPPGFYVKSITSGSTNLLSEPFRVTRTSLPPEIVVTLGVSTPSPWVKLAGRVTGSRPAAASAVTLNGPIGALQANLAADGSFEFPKVLPGTYTAYTNPGTGAAMQQVTIVVPNRDLLGIELALPVVKEVSGRIIVEDGGPLPRPMLTMTQTGDDKSAAVTTASPVPSLAQLLVTSSNVRSGQTPVNLAIQQDGTFKTSLPEGQYQLTVNIPSNGTPPYTVKSFTYGAADLMKDPLKVVTSDSAEMQLTFSPTSPNSFAKVSGRVLGLTGSPLAPTSASVTMNNPSFFSALTTPVRADGTFEFAKVYPGNYQVRLSVPVANVALPNLEVNVAGTDVTNVEIVVPRQKEISGRITLEGRGFMPQFSVPLTSAAAPGAGFGPTTFFNINPQPDGTFKLTVPEGERQVARPNGLPPGYALKSIFYGSTDLASAPLKVSTSDTAELRVTVSTPNHVPVKVSGKVAGVDAAVMARGPVSVVMNAPGYVGSLQTPVSADGSFEFAEVFPGTYSARATGPVTGVQPISIVVGSADVRNVEIVVPVQKEVTGRVVLEGSGPMPRFGFRASQAAANPPGGRGSAASALASQFLNILPNVEGVFRLNLPEGERLLGELQNLPAGYTLKTATYGSTDLLRNPLKIDKADTAELVLTLTAPAVNPVSVSGRVSGLDSGALMVASARVILSSSSFATNFNVLIRPDGSFEFPAVFPGNYSAQVAAQGLVPANQATNVVVSDKGVKDLQLVVPRQQFVSVRIVVEGGGPFPRLPLTVTDPTSANGRATSMTVVLNPQSDGTFRTALPDGRRLAVTQLPAGYSLKSLMYGDTDLRQTEFSPRPTDAPQELRITLEKTTPTPWVSVSGRVVGLPPEARNVRVGLNGAFTPNQQTAINADGTFSFTNVFQGNNTVQLLGLGIPPLVVQFTVGPKDVTNLEIVARR